MKNRIQKESLLWKQLPSDSHPCVKYAKLKLNAVDIVVEAQILVDTRIALNVEVIMNEQYPFIPPSSLRFIGGDLPPVFSLQKYLKDTSEHWSPMKTMLVLLDDFAQTLGAHLSSDDSNESKISVITSNSTSLDSVAASITHLESEAWNTVKIKNSDSRICFGLESHDWFPQLPLPVAPLPSFGMGVLGVNFPHTSTARVPGNVFVPHLLTPEEADRFMQCAERLGFDNHHHPAYQSQEIDKDEMGTRKNDRCVYQASAEENHWLFSKVRRYFQEEKRIRFDSEVSTLKLWGLNDMWRFYKYSEEDQEFPVHFDNMTVKTRSLLSLYSILIYLSDDFDGGETVFHVGIDHSSQQLKFDMSEIAVVKPQVGTMVSFSHIGWDGAMHSGRKYRGGRTPKYVLRTDVMYEAKRPCPVTGLTELRAPYNKPGVIYDYPEWRVNLMLQEAVAACLLPVSLVADTATETPTSSSSSSAAATATVTARTFTEGAYGLSIGTTPAIHTPEYEGAGTTEKVGECLSAQDVVLEVDSRSTPAEILGALTHAVTTEDIIGGTAIAGATSTDAAAATGSTCLPMKGNRLPAVISWAQYWLSRGAGSQDVIDILVNCNFDHCCSDI